MNHRHRSLPYHSLIALSVEKLKEAENALRHMVLFGRHSDLDHSLIEAGAFIRQAISTLKRTLPKR